MSFKGTEHYRKKVEGHWQEAMPEYGESPDLTDEFYESVDDVVTLCDHIDKQSQVVEAARELISACDAWGVEVDRLRGARELRAALGALEIEGDE